MFAMMKTTGLPLARADRGVYGPTMTSGSARPSFVVAKVSTRMSASARWIAPTKAITSA